MFKTTVTGYKYYDTDNNGSRASTLIQGESPNVVLVLDVSGSTQHQFQGSEKLPDLNGDGRENTILDAEIAAAGALHTYLYNSGYADSKIGLVEFSTDAEIAYNGVLNAVASSGPTVPGSGATFEFNRMASTLRYDGWTNFTAGLAKAEEIITGWDDGPSNIIFLSDGTPDGGFPPPPSSVDGKDLAERLKQEGHNIQAFGVGNGAEQGPLDDIDSDDKAFIFESTDDLFDVLSGNLTGGVNEAVEYTEPGIEGVQIYLDIDNSGTYNNNEPMTLTDKDGNYTLEFTNPLGDKDTYSIHETIPKGYKQTEPQAAYFAFDQLMMTADETYKDVNFGNNEKEELPVDPVVDPPAPLLYPDFTPPFITGASIDGNSVTVAFNEEIQDVAEKSLLDNNRFNIRINKRRATINSYSLDSNGRSVTLELEESATPRDNVTIGYKDSTNNQLDGVIQDIVGNDMDSLSKQAVTVTSTSTVLSIDSAEAEGRQIELSFNDSLKRTIPRSKSIKVIANGERNRVKDIIIGSDNMTVTLMMQRDINPGEEVNLTYKDAPGDQKKRVFENDLGEDLNTIKNMSVTTGSYESSTKPELLSAFGRFDEITMNFDQTLKKGRIQAGLFQVKSGSQTYRVRKASVAKRSSQVILDLKNNLPLVSEDPLTISYMDMSGDQPKGVVQAISGLDAGSITDAQLIML